MWLPLWSGFGRVLSTGLSLVQQCKPTLGPCTSQSSLLMLWPGVLWHPRAVPWVPRTPHLPALSPLFPGMTSTLASQWKQAFRWEILWIPLNKPKNALHLLMLSSLPVSYGRSIPAVSWRDSFSPVLHPTHFCLLVPFSNPILLIRLYSWKITEPSNEHFVYVNCGYWPLPYEELKQRI